MTRRTTLAIVLAASLAVACWAAWMAKRPECSCVLGREWSSIEERIEAEVSDSFDDPADCDRHHGEVE